MIFSINTLNESLKNQYNRKDNIQKNDYTDFSFFESSLSIILSERREFEYNMIQLSEGFISKVSEKIKSIDIKELLYKIIDWFIESIKKMDTIIKQFFVNLLNKDKKLKLYKNKLESFNGEIVYNKPSFNYTNILTDSSFSTYKADIMKVYNEFSDNMEKLSKYNTPMELANIIGNIRNESNYNQEYLDNIRGKLLKRNSLVSKEDFGSELFKYFRNGKDNPTNPENIFNTGTIQSQTINEITKFYFTDYQNNQKILQRESSKLTLEAKAIKAKIATNNIFKYADIKDMVSSEVLKEYNLLINLNCRKIADICDIYRLFYSAKLDALKEQYLKDRDILSVVVNEIIKQEGQKK